MKSYFVDNGPVKIHVLESGTPSKEIPSLLVIGGIWEPAERAIPVLSGLSSHVVTFSFRGRGLSSTPETGYDLEDHLSDIEAVVRHCKLEHFCVLGFSRGASYALGWSLEKKPDMRGLILVDQPPVHIKPGEAAVEFWCNFVYQGVPILNFMRKTALEGLRREARLVDFSDNLARLKIPTTFFVGRDKNSPIPSDITEDILQLYRSKIEDFRVVEFSRSGHMIPDEEQQKYIDEISLFLHQSFLHPGGIKI